MKRSVNINNLRARIANSESEIAFIWTTSRARDTYGYNICSLYLDGEKLTSCNGGGYDMKGTSLGNFVAAVFAPELMKLKPEDMPENSHWQPSRKRYCDGKCLEKYRDAVSAALMDDKEPDTVEDLPALSDDTFTCPTCGGPTRSRFNDGQRIDDGRYFYGLTFHDPNFDPSKAVIGEGCDDRTLSENGSEGITVEQAEEKGVSFGLERYQAFYKASSKVPTERHTVPSIDGGVGFNQVEKILNAIGYGLQWIPQRRNAKSDRYILKKMDQQKEVDQ